MSSLIELLVVSFATVALFALGRWIFRSGWGNVAKAIGLLATVSLWWAMANGPFNRHFGVDHGLLTDAFASVGIAIVGTWLLGRVGNDWRRQAGVVMGAFVLLLIMWVPRYYSGQLALPTGELPSNHGSSSTQEAPDGPRITRPPRPSRSTPHHDSTITCDDLSYEGKIAAGCP